MDRVSEGRRRHSPGMRRIPGKGRFLRRPGLVVFILVSAGFLCLFLHRPDPHRHLFDQENLDSLLRQSARDVAGEVGGGMGDLPAIRPVRRIQVQEYMMGRLDRFHNPVRPGPGKIRIEPWIRELAYGASRDFIGIYVPEVREIWVVPDAARKAENFDGHGEVFLRALVLHETVHAADFGRYGDWGKDGLPEEDRLVRFVLFEGHAEHVAHRALIRRYGKAEGDRLYDGVTVKNSWYRQGKKFMDCLYQGGGREMIDRVLRDPHASLDELGHPEACVARLLGKESPSVSHAASRP